MNPRDQIAAMMTGGGGAPPQAGPQMQSPPISSPPQGGPPDAGADEGTMQIANLLGQLGEALASGQADLPTVMEVLTQLCGHSQQQQEPDMDDMGGAGMGQMQ